MSGAHATPARETTTIAKTKMTRTRRRSKRREGFPVRPSSEPALQRRILDAATTHDAPETEARRSDALTAIANGSTAKPAVAQPTPAAKPTNAPTSAVFATSGTSSATNTSRSRIDPVKRSATSASEKENGPLRNAFKQETPSRTAAARPSPRTTTLRRTDGKGRGDNFDLGDRRKPNRRERGSHHNRHIDLVHSKRERPIP